MLKVFEVETLGLDFGLRPSAESKSPALAGLGFSSELSLSAVSIVSVAKRVGQRSVCVMFLNGGSPIYRQLRVRSIRSDSCLVRCRWLRCTSRQSHSKEA